MGNLEFHDNPGASRRGAASELVSILSRSSPTPSTSFDPLRRWTTHFPAHENNAKLIFACLNLMTSRFDAAPVLRVLHSPPSRPIPSR